MDPQRPSCTFTDLKRFCECWLQRGSGRLLSVRHGGRRRTGHVVNVQSCGLDQIELKTGISNIFELFECALFRCASRNVHDHHPTRPDPSRDPMVSSMTTPSPMGVPSILNENCGIDVDEHVSVPLESPMTPALLHHLHTPSKSDFVGITSHVRANLVQSNPGSKKQDPNVCNVLMRVRPEERNHFLNPPGCRLKLLSESSRLCGFCRRVLTAELHSPLRDLAVTRRLEVFCCLNLWLLEFADAFGNGAKDQQQDTSRSFPQRKHRPFFSTLISKS